MDNPGKSRTEAEEQNSSVLLMLSSAAQLSGQKDILTHSTVIVT